MRQSAAQVRAEQFRFFAEALKTSKLKMYVPHFVSEAKARPALQARLACMVARVPAYPAACAWGGAHVPWSLHLTHSPGIVQACFAKWGDEGEVDLSKAFAELIILTASRTLMGAGRALLHP